MPTYRTDLIAMNPEHSFTAKRRWETTSAAATLLKVLCCAAREATTACVERALVCTHLPDEEGCTTCLVRDDQTQRVFQFLADGAIADSVEVWAWSKNQ